MGRLTNLYQKWIICYSEEGIMETKVRNVFCFLLLLLHLFLFF